MPTGAESAALVVLLRIGHRRWEVYADLVEEFGSARAVLERELAEREGQRRLLPEDPAPILARATADIAGWHTAGMRLVTVLHSDYPDNLRAVHDRPPLIFVAGQLQRADARSVAVIGARRASPAGLDLAHEIATHLVSQRYTVVSGLAAGVDAAAHRATLAASGRTVAVIGTGLAHSYPPENAALQRLLTDRGAVVSQFWPAAPPSRRSFPLRNATMSGLALATVVVEASPTSGARIQARLALAHGRPVFLLRRLLAERWARELARRPGTHVIDSPDEITVAIGSLIAAGALVA